MTQDFSFWVKILLENRISSSSRVCHFRTSWYQYLAESVLSVLGYHSSRPGVSKCKGQEHRLCHQRELSLSSDTTIQLLYDFYHLPKEIQNIYVTGIL